MKGKIMKHRTTFLGKLAALILIMAMVMPQYAAATVTDGGTDVAIDANDNVTVNVDSDGDGTGDFIVTDENGSLDTITTIISNAQSTVIGAGDGNTITNSLTVDGTTGTTVIGATTLGSTLGVTGATTLGDTLGVTGNTTLSTVSTSGLATLDSALITNDANVGGGLNVTGATTLGSTLGVNGAATLNSTLDVNGLSTLSGGATINNGSTISSGNGTGNQMIVDANSSRLVSADGTQSVAVSNSGNTITGATTVTSTGTANQMIVDATSSRFVSADGFSNATVADDSVILLADSDGSSANARSRLSMAPTSASLLVNTDSGESHGLTISQTSTVISGGTDSTTLTLDDNGATFADEDTGAPVKVTGVADGVDDFDAVNMRQYRKLDNKVEDAFSGIASVAALAAIPPPVPGKNFSLGVGFGNFDTESAIAVGGKMLVGEQKDITLTGGVGFSESETVINAGLGWSF
jgi:hypothetical protein